MTVEFKLPDLGEGIHEAEIIAVKVQEGEMVKEDQPILEVETDKAVVEIPSPHAGKVAKVHVKAGQQVTVGSVMISYELAGATKSAVETTAPAKVAEPAKTAALAVSSQSRETVKNSPAYAGTTTERDRTRPVPATPATRRLARELGIDLHAVPGSGPAGRVTKEDVMAFAAGTLESHMQKPAPERGNRAETTENRPSLQDKFGGEGGDSAKPFNVGRNSSAGEKIEYPDFTRHGKVERLPLKSIRRKIATNMAQSWMHVPHVTTFDEAEVTELVNLIPRFEKEYAKRAGSDRVRPTMTVFAIKAIASALKLYPQFNSSLDENTGEIVVKHYINIGVAVATERGLIVPVIKNADEKSFYEIAAELAEIAEKTRAGKVELDRLSGGTFTLTNIGSIGGTSMSPMVNWPEAAILGMARAAKKPVVKDDQIVIGHVLPLALSFDHRLADGAEAAYFVRHVIDLLQEPMKFVLSV